MCLVAMFPLNAINKLWHRKSALAQANSAGLPGVLIMLVLAILVEGLTPLCIVTGWLDHPAAAVLAGFCAVTAILYQPFWSAPVAFLREWRLCCKGSCSDGSAATHDDLGRTLRTWSSET